MSASVLYHGFGIRGYQYERTFYEQGMMTFAISQARDRLRCPRCGTPHVERRGEVPRCFRLLPIGRRPVQAVLGIPRVYCAALRHHAAGQSCVRGRTSPLCSQFRALRPGVVAAHDHQGRRRALADQLGYGQGDPEAAPANGITPAPSSNT